MSSIYGSSQSLDARHEERTPTRLRVRFGVGTPDRTAMASNVSIGGLYILTNRVFRVGTVLQLTIEFGVCSMHHRAEVMWAIQVPEHERTSLVHGMGVSFVDSEPGWEKFYRRWKAENPGP